MAKGRKPNEVFDTEKLIKLKRLCLLLIKIINIRFFNLLTTNTIIQGISFFQLIKNTDKMLKISELYGII